MTGNKLATTASADTAPFYYGEVRTTTVSYPNPIAVQDTSANGWDDLATASSAFVDASANADMPFQENGVFAQNMVVGDLSYQPGEAGVNNLEFQTIGFNNLLSWQNDFIEDLEKYVSDVARYNAGVGVFNDQA